MSRILTVLVTVILFAASTSGALAQSTGPSKVVPPLPAATPPAVPEPSTVGNIRVALDVGVGTLSITETYYNTTTYRSEDVTVWSVAGGAAELYLGWVILDAQTIRFEVGYRLSTLFDDTAAFHAHELVGVVRVRSLFASLGVGISGVTTWSDPGINAPRLSVSLQVGFDLVGALHVACDMGGIWSPADTQAIERFGLLLGYTF
jgi:hypothetical protein